MPYGEVQLIPGVNVERTPTLLQTGYVSSQLVRFKDGLVQKYGGWTRYFSSAIGGGVPRDLHAWQDLNNVAHLSVGGTSKLQMITSGSSITDITPQTLTSDIAPNFSTVLTTKTVTIVDANIANLTTYDSVYFNTPIYVGGIVLSGIYQIASIVGVTSYTITAATAATSTVNNGGHVPIFTTTNGTAFVNVEIDAHGLVVGNNVNFPIATTGNGVTIQGHYIVTSIVDANNFQITASNTATAGGAFNMNGGNAEFLYYINLGPPSVGTAYGLGNYGAGPYGTGGTTGSQTGNPITATDWTQDNWGEVLLSCPKNGGVYAYDPTGGFSNTGLVATAPVFNGGLFVSMRQQILVCWASTINYNVGSQQDPMLIKWSDSGDYTNFQALSTTQAGSFRIPFGSKIVGGLAAQTQNLIWTDLDLWAMVYQGQPFIFGFNRIGAGAGLISSHAAQVFRDKVYWMGPSNFYEYGGGGAVVLPCPVWDFVYQNLNTAYTQNIRAMPNTPFNEVGWLFPSTASVSGECDCYVKMNVTEPGRPWDIGPSSSLPRSAWIDQSIIGNPTSATTGGLVYTQESGTNADGGPLNWSFTTGYFYIAEGEEWPFVDVIYPDFKFGTYGGSPSATIQMTISAINYPGDTPNTYGPYTITSSTKQINVRIRNRQMAFTFQGGDTGSFFRLGKVRYRYQPTGRQ